MQQVSPANVPSSTHLLVFCRGVRPMLSSAVFPLLSVGGEGLHECSMLPRGVHCQCRQVSHSHEKRGGGGGGVRRVEKFDSRGSGVLQCKNNTSQQQTSQLHK